MLLGLLWVLRDRIALRLDRRRLPARCCASALPTVPAEVSVFALNIVDRAVPRTGSRAAAAAGLYSLAVKLSAVVILATRALPVRVAAAGLLDPRRRARRGRFYALVATYYVLVTGLVVAALTLLAAGSCACSPRPTFFGAYEAMPWVALGWALYGLFLVLVVDGRAGARSPAATSPPRWPGWSVNVVLLVVLVPPLGIAGAGIALCGAYVVMLGVMYALTAAAVRGAFEWARLARLVRVIGGVTVAGELLLPDQRRARPARAAARAGRASRSLLLATGFLRRRSGSACVALRARAGFVRPRTGNRASSGGGSAGHVNRLAGEKSDESHRRAGLLAGVLTLALRPPIRGRVRCRAASSSSSATA